MRWASPIQSLHLFSGENAFLLVVLGGLQEISYAGFDLAVSLSPAGLVTLGKQNVPGLWLNFILHKMKIKKSAQKWL